MPRQPAEKRMARIVEARQRRLSRGHERIDQGLVVIGEAILQRGLSTYGLDGRQHVNATPIIARAYAQGHALVELAF